MTGESAYNGPTDDGLTVEMTGLSRHLEDARTAHAEKLRREAVSPLVRALLGRPEGEGREDVPVALTAAVTRPLRHGPIRRPPPGTARTSGRRS